MRIARAALALSIAGGLVPSGRARAETLPLRTYDVAEGLANSRVTAILQARRGDLWVATWDGVSRFDGYEFTTFNTVDGLPGTLVTSIAEDRRANLWFGTFESGLARLIDDPAARGDNPRKKFAVVHVAADPHADRIGAIAVDASNRLWCATEAGLYRADLDAGDTPSFTLVLPGAVVGWPQLLAIEPSGKVWAGDGTWVWEIGDGPPVHHALPKDAKGDMWNVALARGGGLWVSVGGKLWRFVPAGQGRPRDVWTRLPLTLGAVNYVRVLAEDDDGSLWIGTFAGLIRWRDGRATPFTRDQGLPDEKVRALRVDRDGNLWIGMHNGGVAKLPRGGLVNFTTHDGLTDRNVLDVVQSADYRLYVATDRGGIDEIEGGRAHPVPGSSPTEFRFGLLAQDREGRWWIGTETGMFVSDGPDLDLRRARKLTADDGLPDPDGLVMGVFRDADGSILVGQGTRALAHIQPDGTAAPPIATIPLPEPGTDWLARRVLRDRAGTLWVSSFQSLGRLRAGKIESLQGSPGLPDTQVRTLLQDAKGRVWLGHRNRGLSMTDEPEADHPHFKHWGMAEGLSSDTVWALGADDAGRIYAGTSRGLDRLDPQTGRIRHFGPSDGLSGAIINSIVRDDHGRFWIGTNGGISVLDPRREVDAAMPPPAYISRVAIAGQDLSLPESGARRLGELELPWGRNSIAFDWVGVGFESGRGLRYETRLEGADQKWSVPGDARSVNYANLGPGRYTFFVRTVSAAGIAGEEASTVSFRVLPPLWRRRWFIALVAAATVGVGFGLNELRVRRLVALERIRRQIATDLHDDVGSGLVQIAVLAEVAKRGASDDGAQRLEQVAGLARTLRDAMSDIVWAIDPRRDRLADLARRLRQVSYDLFEAEGVQVTFHAPPDDVLERIELPPDRRRHLYLAAKESLTNVAKHARATAVGVEIVVEGSRLRVVVTDDGRGFERAAETEGRGLANLERRAAALGGRLKVETQPGKGTTIRLDLPLRGSVA